MGILQWLGFRGRDQVTQTGILSPFIETPSHLSAVTWAHLLDLPEDQAPVTRADAMGIPAIARGRNLICGQIGRLAMTAVRGTTALPSQPWVTAQPESARPRAWTLAWTTDALLFFGRAWWIVTERYAEDGRPARFSWVPEYAISWDPSGTLLVFGQAVPEFDVVRIDAPHEGILAYGGGAPIRAARALARAAARAADNPVPSIDLHQTGGDRLSSQEVTELVNGWAKARRGANGGVAYSNSVIEARTLGQAPEQLLVEGRKAASLEMAQLLGLPAWAVDAETGGSSLTYSNVPSRSRELLDYTLQPYLDAIAGRLSLDDVLPRGTWARFETRALLNPDFAERMAGYKAAQDAGIYSAAECRAMELGQPIESAAELEPANG